MVVVVGWFDLAFFVGWVLLLLLLLRNCCAKIKIEEGGEVSNEQW